MFEKSHICITRAVKESVLDDWSEVVLQYSKQLNDVRRVFATVEDSVRPESKFSVHMIYNMKLVDAKFKAEISILYSC